MSAERPPLPVGGYSPGPAMTEEARAEYDARAEQRRQASIAHGLAVIGKGPDADAMRQAQAAEEERLATTDFRGVLRQAQADRRVIALALVDHQDAAARAAAHLRLVQDRLAELETGRAAAEHAAAARLAARFRSGAADVAGDDAASPAAEEIAEAAAQVGIAQAAADRLQGEANETRKRLLEAQHVVGQAVLDVVKGELARLTRVLVTLDAQVAALRRSLRAAGFALANQQARRGWPVHVMTPRTVAVIASPAAPGGPLSAPDWQGFIKRLYDDADAELGGRM